MGLIQSLCNHFNYVSKPYPSILAFGHVFPALHTVQATNAHASSHKLSFGNEAETTHKFN